MENFLELDAFGMSSKKGCSSSAFCIHSLMQNSPAMLERPPRRIFTRGPFLKFLQLFIKNYFPPKKTEAPSTPGLSETSEASVGATTPLSPIQLTFYDVMTNPSQCLFPTPRNSQNKILYLQVFSETLNKNNVILLL